MSTDNPNNIEYLSDPMEVSMNDDWFDFANEDHFWMKWRFKTLKKLFRKHELKEKVFLEIGCGNAIFKDQFEKEGFRIDGCDVNLNALQHARQGKGRLLLYNIYDKNPEFVGNYDGVFLMDVVEHIEDDRLFVRTAVEYLRDNGIIVINVPAHQRLFSKFDASVGHIRRYNKKEMEFLLKACGVQVVHMNYWGFFLLPVVLLRKIYLAFFTKNIVKHGFNPSNAFIDKILLTLMNIELSLPFINFVGNSLIVIGKVNRKADH